MAVLPSTRSVHLGHLGKELDRRLRLATEGELAHAFPDCRLGAIPPLGAAYGMRTVIDDSVEVQPEVWFEAGDHEHLIHMSAEQFIAVIGPADRLHFGARARRTHR
jgi:Ala-tRNA(Pro) deacylase